MRNHPEKRGLYRFLANPYFAGVAVFVALAVAFSGKFDIAGTMVALALAFVIGAFGIFSHRRRRPFGTPLAIVIILFYAGALTVVAEYLRSSPRQLSSQQREQFVAILESQSEPREQIKLGCAFNDERSCVFAASFLEPFKEAGWMLQYDGIQKLNLPKPIAGIGLFKRGLGTYVPSRPNSGLWVEQTPSLRTIERAFDKIGLKSELLPQADQTLPDGAVGIYFGIER